MASGKKGKKNKGKTLALTDFLQETSGPITSLPIRKSGTNWADEVEEYDGYESRYKVNVVLPTAPKASRDFDDIDMKVPKEPPFMAYLSNLPYDVDEEEISLFFKNLNISSMKIPKDERPGEPPKLKGFGYVQFDDRESLMSALVIPDTTLKNRRIRIEVAASVENDRRRGRMDMGRDRQERSDVSLGDWRSGPRTENSDSDRRGFSRDNRDRDGGGGGGGGFTRDRDGSSFTRDRDRDGGFTRDRDRDGGFSRDREGGFSRDRDNRDRDGGGFTRDRDFNRDRDGGFNRDREGGFGRDRDFHRENRDEDRSGSWRDNERLNRNSDNRDRGFVKRNFDSDRGSRFDDRDRDSDRRGGFRRYDDNREDRNGSGQKEEQEPLEPRQRRKLNLAPRSKAAEPVQAVTESVPSASIFGNAKPVDTSQREREIEEKIAAKEQQDKPRDSSKDRKSHHQTSSEADKKSVNIERSSRPSRRVDSPVQDELKRNEDERRAPPPRIENKEVINDRPPKTETKPRREEKRDRHDKEMPKLKEPEPPNFAANNKFAFLKDDDEDSD